MAAKIIPRSAAKSGQRTDTPKYTEEQGNLRRGTDFLWRIVRASNIGFCHGHGGRLTPIVSNTSAAPTPRNIVTTVNFPAFPRYRVGVSCVARHRRSCRLWGWQPLRRPAASPRQLRSPLRAWMYLQPELALP